jgi:hypothetical protein
MLISSLRKCLAGVMAALLYGAAPAIASDSATQTAVPAALLLPLDSAAFGRLADSVRQGVLAAARLDPRAQLAITVYATADDPNSTVAAYEQALAQGNRLVIGPLTRNGVSRVAQSMQPGTLVLALNSPDTGAPMPENLFAFSLHVEVEGRQIARMAFANGYRSALTVSDSAPLARRVHAAFADEFVRQGGRLIAQFVYSNAAPDLLTLRETATSGHADAIFLALDAAQARLIHPYVNGSAQVYATSQVFAGAVERLRDVELNGVRFVDMPWLLQPDHPAVMVYARPEVSQPIAGDSERLYAFGIDAYRIAADLAHESRIVHEPLDGVTGRIAMTRDRHFVRELTPAQFADGRPLPIATRR